MRIGILGDVHSNIEALTAVVEAMRPLGIDHWLQVGDVVGYGPDPRPCIDLIRELGCTVCLGNHDAAVVGLLDQDYFNAHARAAVEWTRTQIRDVDMQWLRSLPLVVEHPLYTLVHGTLHMPELFGYVLTPVEAQESLRLQRSAICFVGHSHVPAVYLLRDANVVRDLEVSYASEFSISTLGYQRTLVNVGSVGQPRDEDPRAAFATFDSSTGVVTVTRVHYDISKVQSKIRAAGLPSVLADRLSIGV